MPNGKKTGMAPLQHYIMPDASEPEYRVSWNNCRTIVKLWLALRITMSERVMGTKEVYE
jgi:hypothetical protein